MLPRLMAKFPCICQLANDGKLFSDDVAILANLHAAHPQAHDYVDAVYHDSSLQAKELMIALSFPVVAPEAADWVGQHLERDLELLLPVLGLPRLRTAFGSKLLARNRDQWIDAIHEVAVASATLDFFDQGTLELEKTIPGTANNSDVYGLRSGRPFRIDATVIHDNWPPQSASGTTATAYTRNTMDVAETEDLLDQNPKGVVTSAQLPPSNPATHSTTPLSTKVWQALQSKRRQCENGCVNVIAIGLPRPLIDDRGTEDAVLGVGYASVDQNTGQTKWVRHGTGPFVPSQYSQDVANCIDPFRIMSAVWLTRWHPASPLSRALDNPNAFTLLSSTDKTDLEQIGRARAARS